MTNDRELRRVYPEIDPRPESEIIARMRDAILNAAWVPDAYDKREVKANRTQIDQLESGQVAGATTDAVEAAQAAAAAAAAQAAQAALVASMLTTVTIPTIISSN